MQYFKLNTIHIFLFIGYTLLSPTLTFAQELTRIRGSVTDAETQEALPFVNISFDGTTIGTVSDLDGNFYLESQEATSTLKISYIGYDQILKPIAVGQSQTLTFQLTPASTQLEDVTIQSKRLRYTSKGNPAVVLMKNVLKHKEANRPEKFDYYEYDKYEKIEFDFNNISEKFMNKRIMKDFQLVYDYMDTSEVNGKSYLPIFLREISSKVYYQKSPEKLIEYKKGQKMTGFSDYFDDEGISSLVDKMYQDIDIYSTNVAVLTQKFTSPISVLGPTTYKYYIADTLVLEGEKLFKLSFIPRNPNALAFVGNLFITTDSAYAVKKASFSITKNANLNFVDDLFIEQEFEKTERGAYVLKTDKINIDFNVLSDKGVGVYGKRTASYKDRKYGIKQPDEIYDGLTLLREDPDSKTKSDEFWNEARHMELSRSEQGVVEMAEEVKELPAFQRFVHVITLVTEGYEDIGPIEVGPINTFISFNDVEGMRLRLGGRTTEALSDHWRLAGYMAYGFKDEDYKYSASVTRYLSKNPLSTIKATYQKDIKNPGETLEYLQADNFFRSFQRTPNVKKIYNYRMELSHFQDVSHGFSYTIGIKKVDLQPGGILNFLPGESSQSTDHITKYQRQQQTIETFETNLTLRFAPNEQYYNGPKYRVPIPNKHPVFTLNYDKGYKNVFGSDYSYDRVTARIFKRTYVSPLGYIDVDIDGSKLFGKVPYPLLNIPRANQTYSYQVRGYNLMQYLEFVSDAYAGLSYAHYFNGFFMNKIPLIKKLKWRSMITFKGLVGQISEENDPQHNEDLPDYSQNTTALDHYLETSVGIGNIFSFLRLDLVKRWSQLDQPGVESGYALRARVKIEF